MDYKNLEIINQEKVTKQKIYCIKVDELGNFLEPVFIEVELDENNDYTLPQYHYLPYDSMQVFHKPRINFDTGLWEESLTQEEIDSLSNSIADSEPTELELLQQENEQLKTEIEQHKTEANVATQAIFELALEIETLKGGV